MAHPFMKTQIVYPSELQNNVNNTILIDSDETQEFDVALQPCRHEPEPAEAPPTETGQLFPTCLPDRESRERTDIESMFSDVLDEAGMDRRQAMRLVESNSRFKAGLRRLIEANMNPRQFAKQRTLRVHGYRGGYRSPRPVTEQLATLRQFLPDIGTVTRRQAGQEALRFGEGQFVIPRWQRVGRSYQEALLKVLTCVADVYDGKFYNSLREKLNPKRIRLDRRTERAMQKLVDQQMNPRFVLATCQFGRRHAGKSVARARETMPSYEFGHDPFSVACMLLTHPERLGQRSDLWIDCAGAHCNMNGNGRFDYAPFFFFSADGNICLDSGSTKLFNPHYGSSSFFVVDE